MSDFFALCCSMVSCVGKLVGWNYYEANTYIFLIGQPIIYILLGLYTAYRNIRSAIKYKTYWGPVWVTIAVVALLGCLWWGCVAAESISSPLSAEELCKKDMEWMRSWSRTQSDYEHINYLRFIYPFIAVIIVNILALLPQYIYRKRHAHEKVAS